MIEALLPYHPNIEEIYIYKFKHNRRDDYFDEVSAKTIYDFAQKSSDPRIRNLLKAEKARRALSSETH